MTHRLHGHLPPSPASAPDGSADRTRRKRVLVIDNRDSFTYNLVQAFLVLGAEVLVKDCDDVDPATARSCGPTHLVVSPGPGRPEGAGGTLGVLEALLGEIPVLGVCLGHQAIAMVFGARVVPARSLVHGKATPVRHDGRTIFRGLPDPLEAGRYHSLAVDDGSVPEALEVSARAEDGEIMGLRWTGSPAEGIQFHPESVLTKDGPALLANFLRAG